MRERRAFVSTLAAVGPEAPTICGAWTAGDLAIHLVTGEVAAAIPSAPFRWLVGRGVRLDRLAPVNERALASYRGRRDFDWALRRLNRPPPRLHGRGVVAAVSLLEVWAHHEDILAVNDAGTCRSGVDLTAVVAVLARYQRGLLNRHAVRVSSMEAVWHEPNVSPRAMVDGPVDDVARWLAGRSPSDALTVSGEPGATQALAADCPRL